MPRAVDLSNVPLDLSHDPTSQISSDPGLQKNVGRLGDIIMNIPKMIIGTIVGALGGLMNPLTLLETAVGFLGQWANLLKGVLAGVMPSGVGDLGSWFNNGGPFGGILGFFGILKDVPAAVTEHTEAIANLNEIVAATNTTVAYVGDIQDIVSVPRSMLVTLGNIRIAAGLTCADAGHNHGFGLPYTRPYYSFNDFRGDIIYTPIVVDRYGMIDKLRWIVGGDDSYAWGVSYYAMALCVYNPTSQNIEKVWDSGDIKSTTASVSTLTEVQIAMGLNQQVSPGQILFVAHQQLAPGFGQATRAYAAVPQAGIGRPAGTLLDAACYVAPKYSQGIPSSISLASLDRNNDMIPWVAVTANAIETP